MRAVLPLSYLFQQLKHKLDEILWIAGFAIAKVIIVTLITNRAPFSDTPQFCHAHRGLHDRVLP